MIQGHGHALTYLEQYRNNEIEQGLKIGCELDDYFQHKWSQLNIILGHDNAGKSYWCIWYFTVLATKHGLRTLLFMDENSSGKVYRDIIRFLAGKDVKRLTEDELHKYNAWVEHHFPCLDNSLQYTHQQIIKHFEDSGADILFLDPYNAMSMEFNYSNNYKVLNEMKRFLKKKRKTIYIAAHPHTGSGRRGAEYPKGHHLEGYVMPCVRSDIEGGKAFTNKADDFVVLHRLTDHPELKTLTMVYVSKIKDTDSGGKPTVKDVPVMFDFNSGNGFLINGINPIGKI